MKRLIAAAALVAGALYGSPCAQATSLLPNKTVTLPSTTSSLADGSIVSSGSTSLTSGDGGYTASLNYAVYKESVSGMIDFLFQVVNSSNSIDSAISLSASTFAGVKTSVYNVSPSDANLSGSLFDSSGSVLASSASRSGGSGKDKNVSFSFPAPNDVAPGSASVVLEIQTNSKSFKKGKTSLLGVEGVSFNTFAPSPEPASLVLLGGCFAGLGGAFGWRRWRAKARPSAAV
jgi:hypothetical protein